jgi:hypothetical protein
VIRQRAASPHIRAGPNLELKKTGTERDEP